MKLRSRLGGLRGRCGRNWGRNFGTAGGKSGGGGRRGGVSGRPKRVQATMTRTDLARKLAPEVGSFSGADRFITDMFEALGG